MVDRLALPSKLRERLRLGLSELVTNSVRHAGRPGPVEVRLRRADGAIRAEVTDPGEGFAWAADGHALPPADQIGGRGLYLVERIADRWGAERLPLGAVASVRGARRPHPARRALTSPARSSIARRSAGPAGSNSST